MNKIIAALLLIAAVNADAAGVLTCRSNRSLSIDGPRGTMTLSAQNYTVDLRSGSIRGDYITVDRQPWVLPNPKDITIVVADHRGTTIMVVRDDLTFTLDQAGTDIVWGTCVK